jgi:thioester reductase-like protein
MLLGTVEIIKMAAVNKIPIHYVSTLSVLRPGLEQPVEERELKAANQSPTQTGYPMTKIVSEKVLAIANHHCSIPVTVYRPGSICGSSESGAFNKEAYIHKLILGLIELKSFPSIATREIKFDWNPVNVVAEAIVALSLANSQYSFFHLNHPLGIDSGNMLTLVNRVRSYENARYTIDESKFDDWRKKLSQSPNCSLYPLFSYFNHGFPREYHYATQNTQLVLSPLKKRECPCIMNSDIVQLIIAFAESEKLIHVI